MLTGMLLGYLLRKRDLKKIHPIITLLIWLLLFILGIEVGSNEEIIRGLHKVAKVQITAKPCNSPTVKMEVKQPEGESPIKWVKVQLTSGATLFLRNTTVLYLSLLLNKMIG